MGHNNTRTSSVTELCLSIKGYTRHYIVCLKILATMASTEMTNRVKYFYWLYQDLWYSSFSWGPWFDSTRLVEVGRYKVASISDRYVKYCGFVALSEDMSTYFTTEGCLKDSCLHEKYKHSCSYFRILVTYERCK